jgi:hypothetical protein
MKNSIQLIATTVLLCCLSYQLSIGQTNQKNVKSTFKAWVVPMDHLSVRTGYIKELNDSLIVISSVSGQETQYIEVSNVSDIKFRKKGKTAKGLFIGAALGAVTGALIGSATYDDDGFFGDSFRGIYALGTGLIGAGAGGLIGGILGSAKINVPLNGNQKEYEKRRDELEKYLLPQ